MNMTQPAAAPKLAGHEHWTDKEDAKLFLWNKCAADPAHAIGTILFVHGSTMAGQATFDLDVPGRANSSAMDWFAQRGYDCWSVDMEGYGRSSKHRANNAPVSYGADDCLAAATYIRKLRASDRPFLVYGISSGGLRAAMFAQRNPTLVARLALDALVWTGQGSATLAERSKRLPELTKSNRRPFNKAFLHTVFDRDHPGSADKLTVDTMADAVAALDDSTPNGTYIDMCTKLPLVDPEKITMPTLVMRGQWDGIAAVDDLIGFFKRLPNPDKQFVAMPGVAHASFQTKNYMIAYHVLASFFSQPEPIFRG